MENLNTHAKGDNVLMSSRLPIPQANNHQFLLYLPGMHTPPFLYAAVSSNKMQAFYHFTHVHFIQE